MRHKFLKAAAAGVMLLAASVGAPAWSAVIYSQPTDFDTVYASQTDTSAGGYGNFATAYDNFTLGTASNIAFVTWVGAYFNPPAQGVITAFTLDFWTDNLGQPGVSLASFNIPGNCGESFEQIDSVGSPAYSYGCAVNFNALAATPYWLSIVADLDVSVYGQWGWETGTGGDGIAYQDFFGTRAQLDSDLAFALYDEAPTGVPEPFSFAIMGAGLIGMGWLRRRKRAQA